jgi:NAD(P)-dependent dehydrogenase (short-subunit alcohol dehydrogenase family)
MDAVTSVRQLLRLLARTSPPRNAFGGEPAHGPTPAYCVSKAAVNMLTRISARSLPTMAEGVWVGAVCPGDVLTRMCIDEEARAIARAPHTAAEDVVRLAEASLGESPPPSGRFWREGEELAL